MNRMSGNRSRRPILRFGVIVTSLAVLLASCGGAANAPTGAATATATSAAPATPVKKVDLNFGVINSNSSHYLHFVAKAKVWNEKVPQVNITVVAAGSPSQNVAQLVTGQFDLVNYDPVAGYDMYNGVGDWQGKPIADLRILFNDVDFVNVIMVRDDSGIRSIEDLNGQAFHPGQPGSSAARAVQAAFELLGIKPNYLQGSTADAIKAVQDKKIVGYVKATAVGTKADATMLQLAATTKMRAIGFSKTQADQVSAKYPQYTFNVLPKGAESNFYNNDQDVLCFSAGLGQATLKKLDAGIVYEMVKAAFTNKATIDQAYPGYAGYDLAQQTIKFAAIPLHAGTVRYLKEIGVNVPASLIPPEAK
jgi:TRAP transporter TAXI family solute receptor